MAIQVICRCGKKLSAPDSAAGKQAKCPACGGSLVVPRPSDPPESPPRHESDLSSLLDEELDKPAPSKAGAQCPSCGAPITAGTTICARCGERTDATPRGPMKAAQAPPQSAARTAGGLEKVALGLLLVLAGIALIAISIVLLMLGPLLLPQVLGARGTLSLLMAIPFLVIVGGLLGTAGRILCLMVPRQAGAHGVIFGSVALELVSLGIGFTDAAVALPSGVTAAGSLCSLASLVLFVLFLKRLAAYVGYADLAEEAQTLLTTGVLTIGLYIATVVIMIAVPGFACFAALIALGCFVLMLVLVFRYIRLINNMRQAILHETRR